MEEAQPWIRPGCTLGEGPLYTAESKQLHFIDIVKETIVSSIIEQDPPSFEINHLPEAATYVDVCTINHCVSMSHGLTNCGTTCQRDRRDNRTF